MISKDINLKNIFKTQINMLKARIIMQVIYFRIYLGL